MDIYYIIILVELKRNKNEDNPKPKSLAHAENEFNNTPGGTRTLNQDLDRLSAMRYNNLLLYFLLNILISTD